MISYFYATRLGFQRHSHGPWSNTDYGVLITIEIQEMIHCLTALPQIFADHISPPHLVFFFSFQFKYNQLTAFYFILCKMSEKKRTKLRNLWLHRDNFVGEANKYVIFFCQFLPCSQLYYFNSIGDLFSTSIVCRL